MSSFAPTASGQSSTSDAATFDAPGAEFFAGMYDELHNFHNALSCVFTNLAMYTQCNMILHFDYNVLICYLHVYNNIHYFKMFVVSFIEWFLWCKCGL